MHNTYAEKLTTELANLVFCKQPITKSERKCTYNMATWCTYNMAAVTIVDRMMSLRANKLYKDTCLVHRFTTNNKCSFQSATEFWRR